MLAAEPAPLEKATMRKVILRLVPFLMICYFCALLDRVNIGFAALQMNKDLGLTPAMFGFGASLFFVSYFLVEVPSNHAADGCPALDRPHHDHLAGDGVHGWSDRIRSTRCGSFSAPRRPASRAILFLTNGLPSQHRAACWRRSRSRRIGIRAFRLVQPSPTFGCCGGGSPRMRGRPKLADRSRRRSPRRIPEPEGVRHPGFAALGPCP